MRGVIDVERTRLWDYDNPEHNYIGIKKLERFYDQDGNTSQWKVTLIAYHAMDIKTLLELKSNTRLEVAYYIDGRPDIRRNYKNIVKLEKCIPSYGWFENLVRPMGPVQEHRVSYQLEVTCEAETNLDEFIYGDQA